MATTAGPERIAILGGGVHAVVVADCARKAGATVVGYSDARAHDPGHMKRAGVALLGDDERLIERISLGEVDALLLGMAGWGHARLRRRLVARLQSSSLPWWKAVHPRATIAESAQIGDGTVVLASAVVNPLARIGAQCVINTACVVEHHCDIADFAVVSPGATLCGGVRVGQSAFIGAGAVVITSVSIGADSLVGAGAVVIRDVPEGAVVVGNPARPLERRRNLPPHDATVQLQSSSS